VIVDCDEKCARRPGFDEVEKSVCVVNLGVVEVGGNELSEGTNCANHHSARNATQMGHLCSPLHCITPHPTSSPATAAILPNITVAYCSDF